jgi:phosphoribosylanthranilate isomerase
VDPPGVDLDAATGRGSIAALLAAVIGELDVRVELSGGIRDDDSLDRALASGCARVNLSTAAVEDQDWCARMIARHGDRVAVSVDVRAVEHQAGPARYRLADRGGSTSGADLWETLAWLDRAGCARYVVTDAGRDGGLRGPNMDLYRAVTRATATAVIASGGISTTEDLVELARLAAACGNLEGSIIGAALQAGHFTLPEALAAVR